MLFYVFLFVANPINYIETNCMYRKKYTISTKLYINNLHSSFIIAKNKYQTCILDRYDPSIGLIY